MNRPSEAPRDRAGIAPGRRRILVAITGTPSGQRALESAIDLALRTDADLAGLVIKNRLPRPPATVAEVAAEQERTAAFFDTVGRLAVDQAAEHGIDLQFYVQHGPLGRALRGAIVPGRFDLVVIGRPTGRLLRALTAIQACRIPCSVLIAE